MSATPLASNKTYKILTDSAKILDFATSAVSPTTLTPACGYTLSRTYAFANGSTASNNLGFDTSVFTGNSDGKLTISTTNKAKAGVYKIKITATYTDDKSYLYKDSTAALANNLTP